MSRLSQLFWALQSDEMPTVHDAKCVYTSIDLVSKYSRDIIKRMRREYKKRCNEKISN